jgi:mRNA interferase HigB
VHVISKRPLREFWEKHNQAKEPLDAWYRAVSRAAWKTFRDLRQSYASADIAGQFTIFDIGGNRWRVITVIHYDRQMVYVRNVFTHDDYSRWSQDRNKGKTKK